MSKQRHKKYQAVLLDGCVFDAVLEAIQTQITGPKPKVRVSMIGAGPARNIIIEQLALFRLVKEDEGAD